MNSNAVAADQLRLFIERIERLEEEKKGLLDDITLPGVEPGNPNFGAAIGQVRTNEIAFGGGLWKMREYHLKPTGAGINAFRLRLDPLDQTPDDSLNLTGVLDA